jgi:hypothetical protein
VTAYVEAGTRYRIEYRSGYGQRLYRIADGSKAVKRSQYAVAWVMFIDDNGDLRTSALSRGAHIGDIDAFERQHEGALGDADFVGALKHARSFVGQLPGQARGTVGAQDGGEQQP